MKILSSTYHLYAFGKICIRALILNKNLYYSTEPLVTGKTIAWEGIRPEDEEYVF
jgi:hypothetical protein